MRFTDLQVFLDETGCGNDNRLPEAELAVFKIHRWKIFLGSVCPARYDYQKDTLLVYNLSCTTSL